MTETIETVTLVARERIEHGVEVEKKDRKGKAHTETVVTVVEPGEEFEASEDEAERLLQIGAAVEPEEAEAGADDEGAKPAAPAKAEKPKAAKAAKPTKAPKPAKPAKEGEAPASDNPSLVS